MNTRRVVAAAAIALLAALPSFAAPGRLIAVLELRNRVEAPRKGQIDAQYFTDRVREAALAALPDDRLISRENLLELLASSGKKLEECEGECEVETGRRIGADLIVSGEIVSLGTSYRVSLRTHETKTGQLLGATTAGGTTAEQLDETLAKAARSLLAPLRRTEPGFALDGPPAVPQLPQFQQDGVVQLEVEPELLEAYDAAVSAEKRMEAQAAVQAWKRVELVKEPNPYRATAAKRVAAWMDYIEAKQQKDLRRAKDSERLTKVLPLESVSAAQKLSLFEKFLSAYGSEGPRVMEKLVALTRPEEAARALCLATVTHGVGSDVKIDAKDTGDRPVRAAVSVLGKELGLTPITVPLPACVQTVLLRRSNSTQQLELPVAGASVDARFSQFLVEQDPPSVHDLASGLVWQRLPFEWGTVRQNGSEGIERMCSRSGARVATLEEAKAFMRDVLLHREVPNTVLGVLGQPGWIDTTSVKDDKRVQVWVESDRLSQSRVRNDDQTFSSGICVRRH